MPTVPLPLPAGNRAGVYRMICRRLQADPRLKNVVKCWAIPDGRPESDPPPALKRLPWVSVRMTSLAAYPITVQMTGSPLGIKVELAVEGNNPDDLVNLWDAVEACLFPGDGSMATALRGAGAQPILTLEVPAIAPGTVEGQPTLSATGTVAVLVTRRTAL